VGFQDAVGQNFGWLNERSKEEKENERKIVKGWICSYYFFEEDRWNCLKEICWLEKNEKLCRTILKTHFGKFYWFWYEMLIVILRKYSSPNGIC